MTSSATDATTVVQDHAGRDVEDAEEYAREHARQIARRTAVDIVHRHVRYVLLLAVTGAVQVVEVRVPVLQL